MATIGTMRLTANQYLRPGSYIGYVFQPRPVTTSGLPRIPCYVGRGSRLALTSNLPIQRCYLNEVNLTFTTVPPYIAALTHEATPDKTVSQLYTTSGGVVVDTTQWDFRESVPGSGTWDQVEISITEFNKNYSYQINYQSADRDVQDELDIVELRQMLAVGNSESEASYIEGTHYRVVTEVLGDVAGGNSDRLTRATTNSDGTGLVGNAAGVANAIDAVVAGTGSVAFNTANAYIYPYSAHYRLEVLAAGGVLPNRTVSFRIYLTPTCGGNDQSLPIPPVSSSNWTHDFTINENVPAEVTNYQLDSNYSDILTDGIRLNFVFGGVNFQAGDTFDWEATGPQLIEIPSTFFNSNQFSTVAEPAEAGNVATPGSANTSAGRMYLNVDTDYTGTYNRKYYIEVLSIVPGSPRQATLAWVGYGEYPYSSGVINLNEGTLGTLTRVHLENGIYLNFDFGPAHVTADIADIVDPTLVPDASTLASAITLATAMRTAYNTHDTDVGPVYHSVVGPLHTIAAPAPLALASLITFCQEAFSRYPAHIVDSTQHPVIDTVWTLSTTATPTDLATCIAFLNDWREKYNRHIQSVHFTVGDTWRTTALAPRAEYTAKDDRLYTLTTTTVIPGTSVTFQWRTDQWEGGWGNISATPADPYMSFTDSLVLAVRNFNSAGTYVQYTTLDEFTFTTINDNLIDWSLRTRQSESIPSSEIRFDTLGNMTGTPLVYYIILSETPDTILRVKDASTGLPLSYTWITQSNGDPLPYLSFGPTNPNTTIEITYEYRGQEPAPSQIYYVTAKRLRNPGEYEVPIFMPLRDSANAALTPSETTNDLWIMANIAFDTAFFGCYTVQVKSASGDETFTDNDYKRSIDATETISDLSDVVVLNRASVMGYTKLSIEKMSNPFKGRERLTWMGVPKGTPVGDVRTPGSIVYLAKKTLQFSGDSPGRGRVILLANQWCKRDITMDNGVTLNVELDGSFIAGFAAARQAATDSPIQTILKQDTASFTDMATFGEEVIPILGDASVVWLDAVGSGVFRFGESHTIDKSSPDLNEISAMCQKDYVTRRIRTALDENIIGLIIPSPAAAIVQIQSFLAEELANIVSAAFIAPYGSETSPPTIRNISPGSDTYVVQDERDRRRYHIAYWYNLVYPIKWIMGLYSVDSKFWDARNLASAQ